MDGLTAVILLSMLPVLPLILGVGVSYELVSRLDSGRRLNDRAHWALATAITLVLVFAVAYLLFRPAQGGF